MDKSNKRRLREIRKEMINLLGEATTLLQQHLPPNTYTRCKHTWIGNLDAALGGGDYFDKYSETFEKTLKSLDINPDLEDKESEENDDEEWEQVEEEELEESPFTD